MSPSVSKTDKTDFRKTGGVRLERGGALSYLAAGRKKNRGRPQLIAEPLWVCVCTLEASLLRTVLHLGW